MSISFVNAGSNSKVSSGNISSLSLPPAWTPGDIFICAIASKDNVNATMPSGWTAIDAGTNNGTSLRTTTFYKIAASGDTNPSITHLNGSYIEATIVAYRGVDNTNPIDTFGLITVNPSSTTVNANSITTLTDESLVIFTCSISSKSTFSNHSGAPTPTKRTDFPNYTNHPSTFIADFTMGRAGSTDNRTATATSAGVSNCCMCSLKPATATIICITDPTGASIYIDGVLKQILTSGPITVTTGSHTVTFSKAGYNPYTTTVTVTANQVINICAILVQVANITDQGIVICTTTDIASCPTTPIICPTSVNPLEYINFVTIINSTIQKTVTIRFTYTLGETTYHDDITVNLPIGNSAVYAWTTNRRYDVNMIITLVDVSLIS
jgi:hypothetical protein